MATSSKSHTVPTKGGGFDPAAPETAIIHTRMGFIRSCYPPQLHPKQLLIHTRIRMAIIAYGLHDLDALKPEGLSFN